jgi:hypothetical protein
VSSGQIGKSSGHCPGCPSFSSALDEPNIIVVLFPVFCRRCNSGDCDHVFAERQAADEKRKDDELAELESRRRAADEQRKKIADGEAAMAPPPAAEESKKKKNRKSSTQEEVGHEVEQFCFLTRNLVV